MKQQILSAEGSVSNTRRVMMLWNVTWTPAPHKPSTHEPLGENLAHLLLQEARTILGICKKLADLRPTDITPRVR